ncbi:DUF4466 family protein [Parapedobacter sp. ISTM3]|uniref:DUF4466 family protein n=1 Tax=Parapedobacter sp. ISTM3 TaxID=2800130 RepID=UPI001903764E|nr:DUF4466 family protein [Parapedobacter sp. ISTM3]MBK1442026.1 DUF4466 family protein [Parapedobacter sp. ISTM3]
MNALFNKLTLFIAIATLLTGCEDEPYQVPEAPGGLQNDVIKRSIGPNMVGEFIEFAYAMANKDAQLAEATVEASISGAEGTWLEHRSYHTDGGGNDIGIPIGSPAVTTGNQTTVSFSTDTNAATLRYYYRVPEAARGQTVSFTFRVTDRSGRTVSYDAGPYQVSRMDMALDLVVSDTESYISIEDMAIYSAEEAAAVPDKIDLVYLYRTIPNIAFGHAIVSPASDETYRPDVALPAGVNNSTKVQKAWNIRDRQLARLQFGVFVDDVDFQTLDLSNAPNYAVNLREEAGLWVETQDGRYRAYIFLNKLDNSVGNATISIKRYVL